jgi:hypothetical protein
MKFLKSLRKKGLKATLLSIPLQPDAFETEHNVRVEFKRHRVVHTLANVEKFLLALKTNREFDDAVLDSLYKEVRALAFEILSFKS